MNATDLDHLEHLLTPLFLVFGAVNIAAFLYKLRDLLRAPAEGRALLVPICLCIGTIGADFLVYAPAVAHRIDVASGVANLAVMLSDVLLVLWGVSALALMLYWHFPAEQAWARLRWRLTVYGVVAAAMVVLFFLGSPRVEHQLDFDIQYSTRPYIIEFLLLYYAASLGAALTVAYWCLLWAKTTTVWTRHGLRLLAAAMFGAIFYFVIKIVALVGSWFGIDLAYWSLVVAPTYASFTSPIGATGILLPSIGPRLAGRVTHVWAMSRRYAQDLYAFWKIGPLWSDLKSVDPRLIHHPRTWRHRLSLKIRLFWRIIEIRDWQLKLRSYSTRGVIELAARLCRESGLDGETAQAAVVEATEIKVALSRWSQGLRPEPEKQEWADDVPSITRLALAAERARLMKVADAYRRSPIPEATVRTLQMPPATESQ